MTAYTTTPGEHAHKDEDRECANTAVPRNNMNEHQQSTAAEKRRATLAAHLARRGYILHGPATGPLLITRWTHAIECADLDVAEHRARRLGAAL